MWPETHILFCLASCKNYLHPVRYATLSPTPSQVGTNECHLAFKEHSFVWRRSLSTEIMVLGAGCTTSLSSDSPGRFSFPLKSTQRVFPETVTGFQPRETVSSQVSEWDTVKFQKYDSPMVAIPVTFVKYRKHFHTNIVVFFVKSL